MWDVQVCVGGCLFCRLEQSLPKYLAYQKPHHLLLISHRYYHDNEMWHIYTHQEMEAIGLISFPLCQLLAYLPRHDKFLYLIFT